MVGGGKHPYVWCFPIDHSSKLPQNGAGMYPGRDVTFNYCVPYVRVKRPIN